MVVPPSALAASPVDAVTKVDPGGRELKMCFSSSDLPVPACRCCYVSHAGTLSSCAEMLTDAREPMHAQKTTAAHLRIL